LDTLFFDTLDGKSTLRRHSQNLLHHSNIRVSREAVNKRFNERAVAFMSKLLEKTLSYQYKAPPSTSQWKEHFSSIRVMDSTEFKLPPNMSGVFPGYGGDGTQSCAQIQLEYEVFNHEITHLHIGNSLESDRTEGMRHLDTIPKKTLLLRDLGYYTLGIYEQLEKRDIFYISRLHSQISIYTKSEGSFKRITHQEILGKAANKKYIDLKVYIGNEIKHPVRLIAHKLDEKQTNKRVNKTRGKKRKVLGKGEPMSQLNVFVTNVPSSICCAQQLYELYTVRWQIELIFKTWKSTFQVHKIQQMSVYRFQCILLAKLIWVLLNWSLIGLFQELLKKEISILKFSSTFRDSLIELRRVVISDNKVMNWIYTLLKLADDFCQKEQRKNRLKTMDILRISLNNSEL